MEYKGLRIYEEPPEAADGLRSAYVQGIEAFIAGENRRHRASREAFAQPEAVAAEREKFRQCYRNMLGLDKLPARQCGEPVCTYVGEDELCAIYRLVVYPVEQIPFYALLMFPHSGSEPMPMVIAQHGGGGTPELCANMNGKNNYGKQIQKSYG